MTYQHCIQLVWWATSMSSLDHNVRSWSSISSFQRGWNVFLFLDSIVLISSKTPLVYNTRAQRRNKEERKVRQARYGRKRRNLGGEFAHVSYVGGEEERRYWIYEIDYILMYIYVSGFRIQLLYSLLVFDEEPFKSVSVRNGSIFVTCVI